MMRSPSCLSLGGATGDACPSMADGSPSSHAAGAGVGAKPHTPLAQGKAIAFPPALKLPPSDTAADAATEAFLGGGINEPSTPPEAERLAGPHDGSSDASASASFSPFGGSDVGNVKDSRAPSPEPAASLSSLRAASSGSAGTTLQLTSMPSDASLSLAALQALFSREPPAAPAPERGGHSGRRGGASSVVGTFFPVERPRPPPAGDQVNFAQRIMEICFAHTTQWPMALALQFVVDGMPRGAPVDVTVGRSICKSQVSGSRQVIYYVRNPPLLRLARSFDARTVGYRLAGPSTLEWHLSTSPNLPAVIPVAKPATAKRKAAPGGGGGGGGGGSGRGGADWRGGNSGAGSSGEIGQQLLQQQQEMILRQLGLGDLDVSGAAAAAAAALQQVLLPGGAAGAAAAAEAFAAVMAGAAALGGSFVVRPGHRTKRRKQENPARAPFGCAIGR